MFIGRIIDAGIILWSAGSALYTQYAMKEFIRKYKNKLLYMISGKISSFVIALFLHCNWIRLLAGSSIGEMIAKGLDYADAWWGYPRSNGYVFG